MVSRRVIFLFPGQGAQYPGMGLDLLDSSPGARAVFDAASSVLGKDMVKLIRDSDGETLKRTDVSQSALAAAALAAAARLGERGIVPAACAGFSLGEYPALACAGVIGLEDCFRLTEARGRAMQDAVDRIAAGDVSGGNAAGGSGSNGGTANGAPGMAAVLGLAPERVEELIAQWKSAGDFGTAADGAAPGELYAANINSPKQVVVSGSAGALAEAEKRFKEAGARRFVRLAVAGPFHSPFMKAAADAFAPALERVSFGDPAIPLFSNVTGKQIETGAEAKALAPRHMVEPVRWTAVEAALEALGPAAALEAGPGQVLRGLWRDTGSAVPCYGAGTAAEINSLEIESLV